jgi:hypothetical protein
MNKTLRMILIVVASVLIVWVALFLFVVIFTSGSAVGATLTQDAARAQHNPVLARHMLRTYAGRVALEPYTTVTPAPASSVTAHAATACHGDVGSGWIWHTAGIHTGSAWIHDKGWCQNGDRITRDFGMYTTKWSGVGFCMVNVQSEWGWDWYPRWKHGFIRATLGVITPWDSCVGFNTGTAYLRISGWWRDGRVWWDRVKDF